MKEKWIEEAVIYQIMIDRFAGEWKETKNANHFMGGNIQGIINKLDYIQDLGVTAIWISPFVTNANYHGYHTMDFLQIDPHFGTYEDLKELIQKTHAKGMKMIADFVPNHCSIEHPFFQEALHNEESPYRNWFFFKKNNEYTYFLKYKELAKINLDNPAARAYMIDVAKYWAGQGFDAFRIDHAVGPSFNFWESFTKEMKSSFPACPLWGEIWGHGISRKYYSTIHLKHPWKKWLFGLRQEELQKDYIGVLDGVLDFTYRNLLIKTLQAGERILGNKKLEEQVKKHFEQYPKSFELVLFLDNHDTDRFLHFCHGDTSLLLEAIEFSRSWGRPFVLYYGTEQGMTNDKTIFDKTPYADLRVRECMNWEEGPSSLYFSIASSLKKG